MEVLNSEQTLNSPDLPAKKDFLEVSCNWEINNCKQFTDAFTTASALEKPEKIDIEEIVSLETCICVNPKQCNNGPCVIDIKVTNGQRISHIAVVSGAYLLEFFKQYGEYETTVAASVLDEFTCESVCFAETAINPPATEASIKFAKRVSTDPTMWIYGIKLYLTEPIKEVNDITGGLFNPEIIKSFLTKCAISEKKDQKEATNSYKETAAPNVNITAMTTYIDNKFHDMETRLTRRIEEMEQRISKKLDSVLLRLESHSSEK